MNRIFTNICVGAVSSIAGGTIVHLNEKKNIENLKKEIDELKTLIDKYRNYAVKLKMYNNYYKQKYSEDLTIVNGKVIKVDSSEYEDDTVILKQEKVKFIFEGVQYEKLKNNNGMWDVYNLDDIEVGVLDNCNIIWISDNFYIEHLNHINYKHNLPTIVSSDSINDLDNDSEITDIMDKIKDDIEEMFIN